MTRHGDNFILSRAQTIFDLLTRKGVRWRVYKSPAAIFLTLRARVREGQDQRYQDLRANCRLREAVLPPEIAGKWPFRPYFCCRKQPIWRTAGA